MIVFRLTNYQCSRSGLSRGLYTTIAHYKTVFFCLQLPPKVPLAGPSLAPGEHRREEQRAPAQLGSGRQVERLPGRRHHTRRVRARGSGSWTQREGPTVRSKVRHRETGQRTLLLASASSAHFSCLYNYYIHILIVSIKILLLNT